MTLNELKSTLKVAKKRNPAAYQIIGAVSGLGKKKISDIAQGKVEPSFMEKAQLEVLAGTS